MLYKISHILSTSNSIWASDLGIVPVPFRSKHLSCKNQFWLENWKLTWRRLQFERRSFSPSQSCSSCPADREASESRTHLGRFEWSGPEWEDLNLQLKIFNAGQHPSLFILTGGVLSFLEEWNITVGLNSKLSAARILVIIRFLSF